MRKRIETIGSTVLREHVERLTERGPRHRDHPAAVLAALGPCLRRDHPGRPCDFDFAMQVARAVANAICTLSEG